MFTNIKSSVDLTNRVISLQELSKVLSISTEDAFAGSFQVDTLVHEKLTVSA
jgi:E3 ubiquitin-protein ligase TRIP12